MTNSKDELNQENNNASTSHTSCHSYNDNFGINCLDELRRPSLSPSFPPDFSSYDEAIMEMNIKAIALHQKGDYDLACELFQRALELANAQTVSESALPFDISLLDTVITGQHQSTTSYIYQRTEFDEGIHCFEETERINKSDQTEVIFATLLFNIGQTRRKMNDSKGALHSYERAFVAVSSIVNYSLVLALMTKILHNIGKIFYFDGRLDEAIHVYKLALEKLEKLPDATPVLLGMTLNCLGVLYYHKSPDDSEIGMKCFQQALKVEVGALGETHQLVGTIFNNIGRVLVHQKKTRDAIFYYQKALRIRGSCLGVNSLDYAATAFNTAQCLHQEGHLGLALKLYNDFLRVAKVKLGTNHRDIAVVLGGMAEIHQRKGKYNLALELYKESINVGRAALGDNHFEVAMLLNRLGNFLFERENYDDAIEAYKKGLKIERLVLEATHPNIIVTLSNIGEIYRECGNYISAIETYAEVLQLQQDRYGLYHEDTASTYHVIGLTYDQMGYVDHALQNLGTALDLRRKVLGDQHLDVATTLTHLGCIIYRKNLVSTALKLFSEAFEIRKSNQIKDDKDISFTLYNIGLCHQVQGNYREAIECYTKTLDIERKAFGENHKDVAITTFKLGEVYKNMGNFDRALVFFQAALRIERAASINVGDFTSLARVLVEIGNIHLSRGNLEPMMEAFGEASRILGRPEIGSSTLSISERLYAFDMACPKAAAAA